MGELIFVAVLAIMYYGFDVNGWIVLGIAAFWALASGLDQHQREKDRKHQELVDAIRERRE